MHALLPTQRSLRTYLKLFGPLARYSAPRFVFPLGVLVWLILVRTFRWRRYNYIHRRYQTKFEQGKLTLEDAQEVVRMVTRYELPRVTGFGVAFALFKTYAIPTISKTLASTTEIMSGDSVSRRLADTGIFIATWTQCPLDGKTIDPGAIARGDLNDPRANLAIARVNWLHSRYKISNDDYLYTLALFIFEPEVWAAKYGWRSLSTLECYAFYMTWVEVGKRMGIQDIPESPDDFKDWVKEYEARVRYPAQTNHDVAVATIEELIRLLPGGFASKNLARKLSVAVLEDDVRKAMMLEEQPKYLKVSLDIFLKFTAWRIRYFHLPAFKKSSVANPDFPDNPPLMHPEYFQFRPWYKPESKWFLGRWWDELQVLFGRHEDVPSKRYKSEGYRLDTMGPARYEHAGQGDVFHMAEGLQGCPIHNKWKARG
ncbi:hypothetical protein PM082_007652 [Marasmius tenuissimus]|nr:hypothetical protein PM082_007652 [Marasmius tenuissimus]